MSATLQTPTGDEYPPERCAAVVRQAAGVPDGTPPKVDNAVTDYRPAARPGHRAPHVWLTRQGARVSTRDLFGDRCVLLAGPAGAAWCDAARSVANEHRLDFAAFSVGGDGALQDEGGRWRELWGVEPDGAVLGRPDGQVAWRSRGAVPAATAALRGVLGRVLGRE